MWEGLLESLSHQSIFINSSKTKNKVEEDPRKWFWNFSEVISVYQRMQQHSERGKFISFQFSGEAFQGTSVVIQSFGSMKRVDEFAGLGFMFVFPASNVWDSHF